MSEHGSGKDDRGDFEWEECRECDGVGRVPGPHGFDEACLNGCKGGMVKVYADEDEEPDCMNCWDAGCIIECALKDHSPLCVPVVVRSDGGTDTIPF